MLEGQDGRSSLGEVKLSNISVGLKGMMNEMKKIAVLDSMVEAQVLESMLKQQEIPHVIKTYHDSAYDGLFQGPKGWGHVEAPSDRGQEILSLLDGLRTQQEELQ